MMKDGCPCAPICSDSSCIVFHFSLAMWYAQIRLLLTIKLSMKSLLQVSSFSWSQIPKADLCNERLCMSQDMSSVVCDRGPEQYWFKQNRNIFLFHMKVVPDDLMKSSFQLVERNKERGHAFLLRFMTWKCHILLLFIHHSPELSNMVTPGCKGVQKMQSLTWNSLPNNVLEGYH